MRREQLVYSGAELQLVQCIGGGRNESTEDMPYRMSPLSMLGSILVSTAVVRSTLERENIVESQCRHHMSVNELPSMTIDYEYGFCEFYGIHVLTGSHSS
jgi:hypothetical protein